MIGKIFKPFVLRGWMKLVFSWEINYMVSNIRKESVQIVSRETLKELLELETWSNNEELYKNRFGEFRLKGVRMQSLEKEV